jgi:diguanylate cyclase (GGDEF)-like protein
MEKPLIAHANLLQRRAWRRRILAFCALAAIALMFAAVMANSFKTSAERRRAEDWHVHTLNVLLISGRLESSVNAALRGQRGYLITGDRDFLLPYFRGRDDSRRLLGTLRSLTRDNQAQQRNLDLVGQRLGVYLAALDQLIALQDSGRAEQAAAVRARIGRGQIIDFLDALQRVELEERQLLDGRGRASDDAHAATEADNMVLMAIGAVMILLLFAAVASAARAHVHALALAEELHALATTDALTGLPNRRQLMAQMETEVRRAGRSGRPLSLALLDVDSFKAINDRHGHPTGDAVLQAISEELRRVTRGGDVLGRFGGEEFAVLMPDTSLAKARMAGERLRAAIARRVIGFPDGTSGRVTISAGVALLAGGEGCDHLISRADSALYEAKADGRNLVRLAA